VAGFDDVSEFEKLLLGFRIEAAEKSDLSGTDVVFIRGIRARADQRGRRGFGFRKFEVRRGERAGIFVSFAARNRAANETNLGALGFDEDVLSPAPFDRFEERA